MNAEKIIRALQLIGYDVPPHMQRRASLPSIQNITVRCILAPWTHSNPDHQYQRPSAGILIDPHGVSAVNCFSCGFHGTLYEFVQQLQAHDFRGDYTKALAFIFEHDTVDLCGLVDAIPGYEDVAPPVQMPYYDDAIYAEVAGRTHKTYLFDRGFDTESLRLWESGYDKFLRLEHAEEGRFSEDFVLRQRRVTFPVRTADKRLVGAVGRSVNGSDPRYWHYWFFDKGRVLFGEHLFPAGAAMLVVEGPLDCVKVHQALRLSGLLGRFGVVSTFGAKATEVQAARMVELASEIILFYDRNKEGRDGQVRLAKMLLGKTLLTRVLYPKEGGDDPDVLVTPENIAPLLDGRRIMAA